MAYGFMDPRNPYPFGYEPPEPDALNALSARPAPAAPAADPRQAFMPAAFGMQSQRSKPRAPVGATGGWNEPMPLGGPINQGYAGAFTPGQNPLGPSVMGQFAPNTQAMVLAGLRNPAVTNTASTAPLARRGPSSTPPGHPSSHIPADTVTPETPTAGPAPGQAPAPTAAAPATNVFGLTPEQMDERNAQVEALRRYQMGLAETGLPYAEANQLQAFGRTFDKPIKGRGGAARANHLLSGIAEGYTAGTATKQRREVAEMIKQLRDRYMDERDPNRLRSRGEVVGARVFEDDPSFASLLDKDDEDEKQAKRGPEDYWL